MRLRTSDSGRKPEAARQTSNLASGLLAGKRVVALGLSASRKIQIKLGSIMKAISSMRAGMTAFASAGLLAGAFLFISTASAQRTAASTAAAQSKAIAEGRNHSAYDASREVSLQGTVAKFTENSADLPVGAHVLVQTASGQVDVHLGDPRLLKLNNMTIAQGASIRIIGEQVETNQGTFFLARLVQQGTQVVAVRSMTGMPLAGRSSVPPVTSSSQGGAR